MMDTYTQNNGACGQGPGQALARTWNQDGGPVRQGGCQLGAPVAAGACPDGGRLLQWY